MALLTVSDFSLFLPDGRVSDGQLAAMIADVEALAVQAAPCLTGPLSEAQAAAALAILRGAVLRWVDYLGRDDRQMAAGPFSIGPAAGSSERKPLLWPSEIADLQAVCRGSSGRGRSFLGWLA